MSGSFDETYSSEGFSQLADFTRDTHTQAFDYDALGDWGRLTTDGGGRTTHRTRSRTLTGRG